MRTVIASLLIAVLVAALATGAVIYAGWYNVAATAPHWRMTSRLFEVARIRSIKAQAAGIQAPPWLGDPEKVLIGVEHYAAHCAVCHGAPGVPKGDNPEQLGWGVERRGFGKSWRWRIKTSRNVTFWHAGRTVADGAMRRVVLDADDDLRRIG